ncbi:DNA polymerase III subunit delta' [Dyadobacter sp. CECT 9623]|uniref:DNA polymerase III subunit delta n=1 Tax=Dyadobacter linearis TaxID=2823330 RepID=A0ABM8UX12_9BACT|nr:MULTISPECIES: DNA polymerase III subunit delta [unclassified Dyadobacter]MCE7063575.1 DNA polymerase III subunit delta [Dyadobacter sp. CY343]CAG5073339.1 DNA polymerase III subunit delta' [Dyadobacter sp. CECT 9623]
MLFKDIPGLEPIKSTLRRSVKNSHLAHAQLFDFPPGGAGLAMALAFSTYINCENKQEDDACGTCASCFKMGKLIHPDFHFIFPIATSKKTDGKTSEAFLPLWRTFLLENPYRVLPDWLDFISAENKQGNISVEEARGILRKLSVKAYEGEYKILLIWKPDIMNAASSNAILKILEEPPEKTLFLLVSDQSDKLLTTIISRTQRITIPAFSDDEIRSYLKKQDISESIVNQATYLCDGNLSEALKLVQEDEDDRSGWFAGWMRSCYKYDVSHLVKLADGYDVMPKERQKGLLEYALRLFRDMLIWSNGAGELLRVPQEELTFVQNFSKAVTFDSLERMVGEVNTAHYHIERNVRAKMVFLDLSLTIAHFFQRK